MPRARSLVLGFVGFLPLAVLAFGCESIVGIEDRTLTEGCDEQCQACEDYCDLVARNCTGQYQVYQTRDACLGVCNLLERGDPIEPANGNTLACREVQAELAASTGEPGEHCPGAGPGGGGLCGRDCDAYCSLFPMICDPELPDQSLCPEKCEALKNSPGFSLDASYDSSDIECRLIHLSNATVADSHCGHAQFVSTLHCLVVPEQDPSCEDYCNLVMGACTGDLVQYDSAEQCELACAELPQGELADRVENTIGCRNYHTHSALLAPEVHCSHAGPGGAGHCGALMPPTGNCESYCLLAAAACPDEFDSEFGNDATCQEECADFEGAEGPPVNEQYSVPLAEEPDALEYRCRLLHVTRALEDDSECSRAVPPDPCN